MVAPSAAADYGAAIEVDPTNALAFNNLGGVYLDKDDYEHALAFYSEAIRLNPPRLQKPRRCLG